MLNSDQMSHTAQLALLSPGFDVIDHIWNLKLLLPTTDVSCGSLASLGKGWDPSPPGFYREGLWPWNLWTIDQWKELKRDLKVLHLLICLSSSETSEWQQYYEFKEKPSGQQDGTKVSAPKSDELSSVHSGTQGGKKTDCNGVALWPAHVHQGTCVFVHMYTYNNNNNSQFIQN